MVVPADDRVADLWMAGSQVRSLESNLFRKN